MADVQRRRAEDLVEGGGIAPHDVVALAIEQVAGRERVLTRVHDGPPLPAMLALPVAHLLAELVQNALGSVRGIPVVVRTEHTISGRYGWTFAVDDHGRGMPDADLAMANHIVRGDSLASVSGAVGLRVVGRLAAALGAEIRLYRNWSGGVTARVFLPSATYGASARSTASSAVAAGMTAVSGVPSSASSQVPSPTTRVPASSANATSDSVP